MAHRMSSTNGGPECHLRAVLSERTKGPELGYLQPFYVRMWLQYHKTPKGPAPEGAGPDDAQERGRQTTLEKVYACLARDARAMEAAAMSP